MIPTFKLIWRDGAYYVSEPNIDSCEVVRKADHDSTVKGLNSRIARLEDLLTGADREEDTRLIRQQEGGDGYHCIDCKRPLEFCNCNAKSLVEQLKNACRRAEYWKAEHLSGNQVIATLRSENEQLKAQVAAISRPYEKGSDDPNYGDPWWFDNRFDSIMEKRRTQATQKGSE